MLDQETEILISQYADDADELTAEERLRVQSVVAADPEARRLLDEYQALTAALRRAAPRVPQLDWDRLREHISSATSDADDRNRMRIGPSPMTVPMRWALAASVLLCIGLALLATQPARFTTGGNSVAAGPARTSVDLPSVATSIDVSGPTIDPPEGAVRLDISIGQPAATPDSVAAIAQDVVWRPPQINIVAAETTGQPFPPRQ
jgi:hypothetical protein